MTDWDMDYEELETLWESGSDLCYDCGAIYCSCCGCDCWYSRDDNDG